MKHRIPFSSNTASCLRDAAEARFSDHKWDAVFRRDMWRDAVLSRHFDYVKAGMWWWPLPRRIGMARLRSAVELSTQQRKTT